MPHMQPFIVILQLRILPQPPGGVQPTGPTPEDGRRGEEGAIGIGLSNGAQQRRRAMAAEEGGTQRHASSRCGEEEVARGEVVVVGGDVMNS